MKNYKQAFILRDNGIRDRCNTFIDTVEIGDDKPIKKVTIEDYKKDRSAAQNRLMWMWLNQLARHLQDEHGLKTTSEDMKDYFQRGYLGNRPYVDPSTKGTRIRVIGTSELDTAQFTEFLNHIDVYAGSELGLTLPHPEDVYYEAMGR